MNCIAPQCPHPRTVGALFCDQHMTASSGQRGGWISSFKRRQTEHPKESTVQIDASPIIKRLWIGSKPPFDKKLPFDVLVLCAAEIQPAQAGAKIIRAPMPDSVLQSDELRRALGAAQAAAQALRSGKRVLVTCAAGLNRSALVAGLSIGMVTRLTADEIVHLIRSRRSESALGNPHFVSYLQKFVRTERRQS